jgi:hypothetical protein
LDCGRKIEVPADDAPDQTGIGNAIQPTPIQGIGLGNAKDQRQRAWLTETRRFRLARLVDLRELMDDLLSEADAAKSADGDRVPRADQPYRISRRDNLAGVSGTRRRDYLSGLHDPPPLALGARLLHGVSASGAGTAVVGVANSLIAAIVSLNIATADRWSAARAASPPQVGLATSRDAQNLFDRRSRQAYLSMNSMVCSSAAGVTLNRPV